MGHNLKTREGVFKNTAKKTKITMSQSCCTSTTDCSDCCSSCHTMCLKTLSHCLKKGVHMRRENTFSCFSTALQFARHAPISVCGLTLKMLDTKVRHFSNVALRRRDRESSECTG